MVFHSIHTMSYTYILNYVPVAGATTKEHTIRVYMYCMYIYVMYQSIYVLYLYVMYQSIHICTVFICNVSEYTYMYCIYM